MLSDRSPTSGHWNDKEKEEEAVERSRFLGGFTAASLGVLLESSFSEPARAQTGARLASRDSFETTLVEVPGNTVFVRRCGKGPAILLVHGFPRTSLMWRLLAPKLAENHTVICVDLRPYATQGEQEGEEHGADHASQEVASAT